MNIRVEFKDGSHRLFEHRPRSGGSWDLSYILQDNWITIIDEWENKTIFPMDAVKEVRIE